MTSIKRAGRITTFGFAVGAGLLIASGAGAAAATAAPGDSGHGSSSSTASSASSSARSARPSTGTTAKPKPASTVSARSDHSAPVVQLHTAKRAPAAVSAPAVSAADDIAAGPAAVVVAKQVAPKRAPALPTPAEAQQAIADGLGTVRRSLDNLREKIETLVQNQITGFSNSLLDLRIDLQRVFSNKPLVYGDPANSQYWVAQGDETAYLMAVAMAINRFTGETVTAASLVAEAMATNSTVRPDRKMYLGPTTSDYVWAPDAYQLAENHGIKMTTTYYNLNQGRQAFNALESALAQGKSVIVTITGPTTSVADPGPQAIEQHPVVLLAIDITNDVVYLNDGALPAGGQKLTMPLDKFIDTWRTSFYSTTTAELAPITTQTVSPATEAIAA
ncbi:C39 family peptidase [Mycobacterium sp. RTGN5]|uniref:C39 family peptidase n=1 Tax=Mycobacterium sp. RTGN5 TaxID=3016522 RepID=UPI0029C6E3C3|nr:C39 family peptidase [Mycobacterium sp. RTGN5]